MSPVWIQTIVHGDDIMTVGVGVTLKGMIFSGPNECLAQPVKISSRGEF